MKVMNLDVLAQLNRTLTLNGKVYEIEDMTVENFIETTKAAQQMGDDATFIQKLESTIDMIVRSIPTIDAATLKKLKLEQLTTIVKFVRGELDDEVAGTPTVPAAIEGQVLPNESPAAGK